MIAWDCASPGGGRKSEFATRRIEEIGVFAERLSSMVGLIGIDFGSRGVKMLQVRERGGRLHVVSAARIDVPLTRVGPTPKRAGTRPEKHAASREQKQNKMDAVDPAAAPQEPAALTHQQVRAAFEAGGFAGRRCVVSLAREDVSLLSVRLPKMPDDELRQSAIWEASQRCSIDRNAMEVDFIRTSATPQGGDSREEVILVAASHAAIYARLEPLLEAGLQPVAIDLGCAALARIFSRQVRREADRVHVRALVEVGASGSIVMILRGDQIAMCKPIAIGGMHFNQAVAEHLQMDERAAADLRAARIAAAPPPGEESAVEGRALMADPATDRVVFEAVRPLMGNLVKEAMLCLRYYGVTFRGHPPERIILTGGDGLEPRLAEMMAKVCKTPVVFDDEAGTLGAMIPQIQTSLNRTPGPAACWALAAGLSARGISAGRKSKPAAPVAIGTRGAA